MCGIFGIVGHKEASNLTYLGLYALQHRGQEAAGIVSTDGEKVYRLRRRSLVADAFDSRSFDHLKGTMAVGHVRYSTSGDGSQFNKQPFVASGPFGTLSVAHNGNLTNFTKLRGDLESRGAIFQSTMDSEIFLHLAASASGATLTDRIANSLQGVEGAYSLLFLSEHEMIAVRDPLGFRPLCLGRLNGSVVVSSETCAFDLIGAQFERELLPGEVVTISAKGEIQSRILSKPETKKQCIFEHIYFARPDSNVFGRSVYATRKEFGRELARECPIKADLVTPVPDSGVYAAIGYADETGIPLEMGFIRNHYIGRTFIEPKQNIRGFGVKVKLNPIREVLKGREVVVIDDSIVRGTTSKKIVKMMRDAGARRVHLLISSPPVTGPCYYGIDTPTKGELIGANQSVEEIRKFIDADTLHYLSLDGVYRAVRGKNTEFCDACFSGNYPTSIPS